MTKNSLVNPAHAKMDTMPNKNKRITRNKTDCQYHGVNAISSMNAVWCYGTQCEENGKSLTLRLEPKQKSPEPNTINLIITKQENYT